MTISSDQRMLLARLADVLIPADDSMPSASEAGVAEEWLDAVLTARPDLVAGLSEMLDQAAGQTPVTFVARLRENDPAAFGILSEITAGAYFMNPAVQAAIGYGGQGPRPIDPHPDYLDDGLLESVVRRGPIYRPTPDQRQ